MPYNSRDKETDIDYEGYIDDILSDIFPKQEPVLLPEQEPVLPPASRIVPEQQAIPSNLSNPRTGILDTGVNTLDLNPRFPMDTNFSTPPVLQQEQQQVEEGFPDVIFRNQSNNMAPKAEPRIKIQQPLAQNDTFSLQGNVMPSSKAQDTIQTQTAIEPASAPISKMNTDSTDDSGFRESVGGFLVAIGAGIQGNDASKALDRYSSFISNNKQEAKRQALEEERKKKNDAGSQGNVIFRSMFDKYVPGAKEMMGKNFENMTEDMLRSGYPMIANGIKAAAEKELNNPVSAGSINAVRSYNEMIASFKGKVSPLAEGKISAKQVDAHMGNINNVLRYLNDESDADYRKKTLEQQSSEKALDRTADKEMETARLGLKEKEYKQNVLESNRRNALERDKFAYQKQKDAEARKQAELLKQTNSAMLDKEARRIAEKYPYGVMLKDAEANELIKKQSAYNKMKSALNGLEKGIAQYGASANPMSDGYRQVDALWSAYMLAVKDAEEMGALDKGVEGAANRTLMNPVNMNLAQRFSGGEARVKEDALSILKEKRESYKKQYAKNTSNYGFNPELSAQQNIRLMDEYINPNTSREKQQQIYLQNYKKLGYDPELFIKYAENYETRRKIITGEY